MLGLGGTASHVVPFYNPYRTFKCNPMKSVEIRTTHFFQEFYRGHCYSVRITCKCTRKLSLAVVTNLVRAGSCTNIKFANYHKKIPGGYEVVHFDWITEVVSRCEKCATTYLIKPVSNDLGLLVEEYLQDTV